MELRINNNEFQELMRKAFSQQIPPEHRDKAIIYTKVKTIDNVTPQEIDYVSIQISANK